VNYSVYEHSTIPLSKQIVFILYQELQRYCKQQHDF